MKTINKTQLEQIVKEALHSVSEQEQTIETFPEIKVEEKLSNLGLALEYLNQVKDILDDLTLAEQNKDVRTLVNLSWMEVSKSLSNLESVNSAYKNIKNKTTLRVKK